MYRPSNFDQLDGNTSVNTMFVSYFDSLTLLLALKDELFAIPDWNRPPLRFGSFEPRELSDLIGASRVKGSEPVGSVAFGSFRAPEMVSHAGTVGVLTYYAYVFGSYFELLLLMFNLV
jgi:hypothetical protein